MKGARSYQGPKGHFQWQRRKAATKSHGERKGGPDEEEEKEDSQLYQKNDTSTLLENK